MHRIARVIDADAPGEMAGAELRVDGKTNGNTDRPSRPWSPFANAQTAP